MIVAKCENASTYKGISPLLDRALDLLKPEFLSTVGTSPVHVDGDKLYAARQLFETAPEEETVFESHVRYLDIHVVLKGEERLDVVTPEQLSVDQEKSDPEKSDFFLYTGASDLAQSVVLRPGDFLVVFPDDAHRCRGQVSGPCRVEKIVFKVLWDC